MIVVFRDFTNLPGRQVSDFAYRYGVLIPVSPAMGEVTQ